MVMISEPPQVAMTATTTNEDLSRLRWASFQESMHVLQDRYNPSDSDFTMTPKVSVLAGALFDGIVNAFTTLKPIWKGRQARSAVLWAPSMPYVTEGNQVLDLSWELFFAGARYTSRAYHRQLVPMTDGVYQYDHGNGDIIPIRPVFPRIGASHIRSMCKMHQLLQDPNNRSIIAAYTTTGNDYDSIMGYFSGHGIDAALHMMKCLLGLMKPKAKASVVPQPSDAECDGAAEEDTNAECDVVSTRASESNVASTSGGVTDDDSDDVDLDESGSHSAVSDHNGKEDSDMEEVGPSTDSGSGMEEYMMKFALAKWRWMYTRQKLDKAHSARCTERLKFVVFKERTQKVIRKKNSTTRRLEKRLAG